MNKKRYRYRSHSLATILLFLLAAVLARPTPLRSQPVWQTGSASVNMGFPVPNQNWSVSGDVLDLALPGQGVGGFQLDDNGNNLLIGLAYELYVQSGDTLADVLLCIIQDTLDIQPGTYPVAPLSGEGGMLAWIPGMDLNDLVSLIDTSFTLDSLANLDPYLALTGSIAVEELTPSELSLSFNGNLLNTSLEFLTFEDGSLQVQNTLPDVPWGLGRFTADDGTFFDEFSGELNPLDSDQGVGAIQSLDADTLTTIFIAYRAEGESGYLAHGMVLRDLVGEFGNHNYQLGLPGAGVPAAFSFETPPLDLPGLLGLLSGEVPLDTLLLSRYSIYSPPFGITWDEDHLSTELDARYILTDGSLLDVHETWDLGTSWAVLGTTPVVLAGPTDPWLGNSYPNPFNTAFHLPLHLPEALQVDVVLVDMLGRERMPLGTFELGPGTHILDFELRDPTLTSGWYGCRLTRSDGLTEMRHILFLK